MKRIIPLASITLGIVLSLGALILFFLDRSNHVPIVDLPDQLAGLPLSDSQQGTDTITVITNLHGKQFPIDHGAVGVYGNREITLWLQGRHRNPPQNMVIWLAVDPAIADEALQQILEVYS